MTHYHFENRFIMKDDEGNVIQDRPWNPDETSYDAIQCTECKVIFRAEDDDEDCLCSEEGKINPPRDEVQAVHCDHCAEPVLAHDFIDHLSDCMSY